MTAGRGHLDGSAGEILTPDVSKIGCGVGSCVVAGSDFRGP